jgi:diacylglycerol O-acyltransferase-1
LLFVSNIRLIVENYLKYGLLLSVPGKHIPTWDWTLCLVIVLLSPLHVALALEIEKAHVVNSKDLNKSRNNNSRAVLLHTVNTLASIVLPCFTVYYYMYHPVPGTIALIMSCITLLKVYSFAACNREMAGLVGKDAVLKGSSTHREEPSYHQTAAKPTFISVPYPNNLTYRNVFYFYAAPTLCYQTSYPRTKKIRKLFLLKRVIEMVVAQFVMYLLIEQYAQPTVQNSLKAFDELKWGAIAERVLKLSITSIYVWVIMFYSLFHSFLNAMAEVR